MNIVRFLRFDGETRVARVNFPKSKWLPMRAFSVATAVVSLDFYVSAMRRLMRLRFAKPSLRTDLAYSNTFHISICCIRSEVVNVLELLFG